MRNLYLSLLMTATLYPLSAFAQVENGTIVAVEDVMPVTPLAVPSQADTQTRLWLQLQESGAVSDSRYALPGQAATLIYQRYLNSFSHPIPLQFKRLDFTGSSGSATGSGSGR